MIVAVYKLQQFLNELNSPSVILNLFYRQIEGNNKLPSVAVLAALNSNSFDKRYIATRYIYKTYSHWIIY